MRERHRLERELLIETDRDGERVTEIERERQRWRPLYRDGERRTYRDCEIVV